MAKQTVYALYKGDTFIDIGTAGELAKKLNCTVKTIYQYAMPARHKKSGKNALMAFRIEDDDDELACDEHYNIN